MTSAPTAFAFFMAALFAGAELAHGREGVSRVEAVEIAGKTLRGNPLGDPIARRAAVISPSGSAANDALPTVFYLPGWGGSPDDYLSGGGRTAFTRVVEETKVRLVVADGRTRWGGSQFINSPATGNYADYVSDEVVRTVEARYRTAPGRRLIAGHSSGAYGALRLAMEKQKLFAGVVALSPDSDFEATHRGLVSQPNVRRVTRTMAESWMPPATAQPGDGLVQLICGLCANYAPLGAKQPGHFAWLYDDRGAWQAETWQRWLDADPLTLIRRNRDAFAPTQRVYLDGAERDEFLANVGARNMHAVLRERPAPVTFYESPGGHSDHLAERLIRGVKWALEGL
jgi:pimeloyl-ACP methyl ester carboxylesterase